MRALLKILLSWVVCLLLVQRPSLAHAQQRPAVVISSTQVTPMVRRLRQEIEGLGLSVLVRSDGFGEHPPRELSTPGIVAAVEVVTTNPATIVLYVLEPNTNRIIRQELPMEAPNDPTATALVTTRAVELLRAARLEVSAATKPNEMPRQATTTRQTPSKDAVRASIPELRKLPGESSRQLQLGAGLGFSYVPHWRASYQMTATATYLNRHGIGWVGTLAIPIAPARIRVPDVGHIDAYPTTFRIGVAARYQWPAPIGLGASSGIEWNQLRFTGDAAPPYKGGASLLSTMAPWAAVGTNVRLSSQFQLLAQLSASWATQRTIVRVDGQEVGTWGRFVSSAVMTLEWRSL